MGINREEMEQKLAISYLPWILFILFFVYTAIGCVGFWLGYRLVLYHSLVQSAMIAFLLLVTTMVSFQREITLDARGQVVVTFLLPLTILVQMYLITREGGPLQRVLYILFAVISIVSVILLFFRYGFCLPLKIVCGIVSVILMVIWILIALVMSCVIAIEIFESIFGEFGKTSVVKQVSSPNLNYVAEVLDVDLGATGGSTLVNVKMSKKKKQEEEIPVLLGKLEPQQVNGENVYEGEWGEFETMVIEWKDNRILIIDGKEYAVD